MLNCLVTGGAGFIGTNLIIRLLKDGYNVVSFDNYSTGYRENHMMAHGEGCEYIDTDLSGEFSYDKRFDIIFHMAALPRIGPSFKNPKDVFKTNVNGTSNVLEYARKRDIPVIYAGSSSVHGGKYKNPYTFSKWQGEELCKMYGEIFSIPTAICRFYNVYGEHHIRTGDYATVVGIFENQFLNKESLTITADGKQRRDFTHIDDIVEALISCAGKDFRAEEFELGRGINYSINEIADMFGEDYPKEYIQKRPGEYPETLADSSNAKNILGWDPTKKIGDYITNWIKENK